METATRTRPVVMAVDDDAEVLEAFGALLASRYDYRPVREAARVPEELAAARPDALILDVNLGGGDGVDILRRLRADPATRWLPVLLLTGCGDKPTFLRGAEAGCDAYLTKPVSPDYLRRRLAELLGR